MRLQGRAVDYSAGDQSSSFENKVAGARLHCKNASVKLISAVNSESGPQQSRQKMPGLDDEELKDSHEEARKVSPNKRAVWNKGSPTKRNVTPTKEEYSLGISAQEKAFAKRLREEKQDELMNKTQVRSAWLHTRDGGAVQMCFYSDRNRLN